MFVLDSSSISIPIHFCSVRYPAASQRRDVSAGLHSNEHKRRSSGTSTGMVCRYMLEIVQSPVSFQRHESASLEGHTSEHLHVQHLRSSQIIPVDRVASVKGCGLTLMIATSSKRSPNRISFQPIQNSSTVSKDQMPL